MNICFMLDLWDGLDPETNSSLRLVQEAVQRGHKVGIFYSRNLTVRDNVTYGLFLIIDREIKYSERPQKWFRQVQFKRQRLPLNGFDVVFLRKNPPLETTALNFLDSIKDDTLIINSVDGLRKANNKLYLTNFEDSHEFIPETHVSKDKDYLLDVIREAPYQKMILKPLDGYGGRGVIVIEKRAMKNINSLLDFYIGDEPKRNYVIIQEFVEGAENGDVRVLMLGGQPVGAMRRIPEESDNRANVHAGARVEKHSLTKKELEICRLIGPKLVSDGLLFAGIDLIGEKLIEVNVTSPGGIININRLAKSRIERKVLDYVEDHYRKRDLAYRRKLAFRQEVEDA
jgi:glutathione synthase